MTLFDAENQFGTGAFSFWELFLNTNTRLLFCLIVLSITLYRISPWMIDIDE